MRRIPNEPGFFKPGTKTPAPNPARASVAPDEWVFSSIPPIGGDYGGRIK